MLRIKTNIKHRGCSRCKRKYPIITIMLGMALWLLGEAEYLIDRVRGK